MPSKNAVPRIIKDRERVGKILQSIHREFSELMGILWKTLPEDQNTLD